MRLSKSFSKLLLLKMDLFFILCLATGHYDGILLEMNVTALKSVLYYLYGIMVKIIIWG